VTLYSIVLFSHVVSALGIFVALSFEAVTLLHLRRAANSSEARLWFELAPGLPALGIASLVVMLLSGIFMTTQMSGWTLAWPRVSMLALVLIAPLGAITGRKMRAIRLACAARNPNESDLLGKLRDPFLKYSMNIRTSLVLGIVLLMTAKPGLRESVGIIFVFAILGIVSAGLFWRQDIASPIARAESRQ
jgi:amino acid transporter